MLLTVNHHKNDGEEIAIDLDDLVAENGTQKNASDALELIVSDMAHAAGVKVTDIYPEYFVTDEDDWIDVASKAGETSWIIEAATLAVLAKEMEFSNRHTTGYNTLFAFIMGEEWKRVNFRNLKEDLGERFECEFEGYIEFAKRYMYEIDEYPSDHLEPYVDFEEYGETVIEESYHLYEYSGIEYVFTQA